MKILFLTSSEQDYLSDCLLLGLRRIYGPQLVDYPRRDILYRDCPEFMRCQVRGHGFTLYTGLLEEIPIDRYGVGEKLVQGEYDLVIISDIWRQFGFFSQWRPYLHPENTIIVDGSDTDQVYPHAGYWWRRPRSWFLPAANEGFLYFKRELTSASRFNLWHRVVPQFYRKWLPHYEGLRRISFGIPPEKIVETRPNKTKNFSRHIVDREIAKLVPGSSTDYAFDSEADYYADLQTSRFGVTTRRAGWDCLRHYEIAANGAVPCFRDLPSKPADCAPHDLIPGENCLTYRDAGDLMAQIEAMLETHYDELQRGAIAWARAKSCTNLSREMIGEWQNYRGFGQKALASETCAPVSVAGAFHSEGNRPPEGRNLFP